MSTVSLKVEAGFGVSVKVGDVVETGTQIGLCSGGRQTVTSPVAGVVRDIEFCGAEHVFMVVIEEKNQPKCGN